MCGCNLRSLCIEEELHEGRLFQFLGWSLPSKLLHFFAILMAPGEDIDSGLSSMSSSNRSLSAGIKDKDVLPDEPNEPQSEIEGDNEDLDETLTERLWGLTEMLPEGVRNATYTVVTTTLTGMKGLYSLSRAATWIFFSSSVILFAPLIFEMERAQMQEVQRSQQKQVLLGPGSAVSGGLGMMPPVQR